MMYEWFKNFLDKYLDDEVFDIVKYIKYTPGENFFSLKKKFCKANDINVSKTKTYIPVLSAMNPKYTKYGIRYDLIWIIEDTDITLDSTKVIKKNYTYIFSKISSIIKIDTIIDILIHYIYFYVTASKTVYIPIYRKTFGWISVFNHQKYENELIYQTYVNDNVAVFKNRIAKLEPNDFDTLLNYIFLAPLSIKIIFTFSLMSIYNGNYISLSQSPQNPNTDELFPERENYAPPTLCIYGQGTDASGAKITRAEIASLFLHFTKPTDYVKGNITTQAPHFTLNSLEQKKKALPRYGDLPIIVRPSGRSGKISEKSVALNKLFSLQEAHWILGTIVLLNETPIYHDKVINVDISGVSTIDMDSSVIETMMLEYIRFLEHIIRKDEKEWDKIKDDGDYYIDTVKFNYIEQPYLKFQKMFDNEKYDGNRKQLYIDLCTAAEIFSNFVHYTHPNQESIWQSIKNEIEQKLKDEAVYEETPTTRIKCDQKSKHDEKDSKDYKKTFENVLSQYKTEYGSDLPVGRDKLPFVKYEEFLNILKKQYPDIKPKDFIHNCINLGLIKSNGKQLYFSRILNNNQTKVLVIILDFGF